MNRHSFELLADMISSKVGVTFKPSPDWTWAANLKDKAILYPNDVHYTDEDVYCLSHEAAHIKYTTLDFGQEVLMKIAEKSRKPAQQLFALLNALEDHRVDYLIVKDYPGLDDYEIASLRRVEAEMLVKAKNPVYVENASKARWMVYAGTLTGKDKGFDVTKILNYNVSKDKEMKAAFANTEHLLPEIRKAKDTIEVFEIMKDKFLPWYLPLCDDFDQKKSNQEMKQALQEMEQLLKEMLQKAKAEFEKQQKQGGAKEIEGSTVKEGLKNGGKACSLDAEKPEPQEAGFTAERYNREVARHFATMRKAVSVLKDKDIERFEGAYSSGKLLNRRLAKMKTGNYKIFTRKTALKDSTKNMIIAVLVDVSGSMDSEENGLKNIQHACISVGLLSKALQMTGRRHIVWGFDTQVKRVKDIGEKMGGKELVKLEQMCGGGTDLQSAITKMHNELKKYPENKRILVAITDGDCKGAQESTNEAEKDGIHVYGIGLGQSVSDYFNRHIQVKDASELGPELYKIFRRYAGKRSR